MLSVSSLQRRPEALVAAPGRPWRAEHRRHLPQQLGGPGGPPAAALPRKHAPRPRLPPQRRETSSATPPPAHAAHFPPPPRRRWRQQRRPKPGQRAPQAPGALVPCLDSRPAAACSRGRAPARFPWLWWPRRQLPAATGSAAVSPAVTCYLSTRGKVSSQLLARSKSCQTLTFAGKTELQRAK